MLIFILTLKQIDMDERYLSIVMKNIKSDMDAMELWNKEDKIDKFEEYADDCIKRLKELKDKVNS